MTAIRVSRTVLAAFSEPQVCTLQGLLEQYELPTSQLLTSLVELDRILVELEFEIAPPIGELGLRDDRVLKKRDGAKQIETRVRDAIEKGENSRIEFKASIFINTKKLTHNSELEPKDCIDERLKEKAAQEIAAFLNAEGGRLIFGVEDDGSIRGCEDDFSTFSRGGSPTDKAELIVKEIVSQHFRDADVVFYHIKVECALIDGKQIVVASIAPRSRLAFLKKIDPSPLYVRIGSHAIPIPFQQIEEYFELKPR
jgi:hypothetical protein